eukprot:5691201-Pleurochrysis_carterae.AAC.1
MRARGRRRGAPSVCSLCPSSAPPSRRCSTRSWRTPSARRSLDIEGLGEGVRDAKGGVPQDDDDALHGGPKLPPPAAKVEGVAAHRQDGVLALAGLQVVYLRSSSATTEK